MNTSSSSAWAKVTSGKPEEPPRDGPGGRAGSTEGNPTRRSGKGGISLGSPGAQALGTPFAPRHLRPISYRELDKEERGSVTGTAFGVACSIPLPSSVPSTPPPPPQLPLIWHKFEAH